MVCMDEPRERLCYTPDEAAQLLGLHINTVYRYLHNNTLPGKRLGKKLWLIPAAALTALLTEQDGATATGHVLD